MFISDKAKRDKIKKLLQKNTISIPMLLKLTLSEITELKSTFTLKQILKLMNAEFGTDIRYTNFQRYIHRLDNKPLTHKENLAVPTRNNDKNIDYDLTNDLNVDDLI